MHKDVNMFKMPPRPSQLRQPCFCVLGLLFQVIILGAFRAQSARHLQPFSLNKALVDG